MNWGSRFERFVARKVAEAARASLPPYRTDFESPDTAALPRVGNAWTMQLFDGPFYASPAPGGRAACGLVFVQSKDGNTGARNPSLLGGGETDKHLIYEGLSRVAADAVLAGASTVRGSQLVLSVWHPQLVALRAALGKPRHPMQVVVTRRGLDLDRGLMFNVPEVPVVLLASGDAEARMRRALAARPWIVTSVLADAFPLSAALHRLRQLGVERISAIGGRSTAAALMEEGVADDLYLTTSSVAGGEPNTPLYPTAWTGTLLVRKRGTGLDSGVVFEHWQAPKPEA